MQIVRDRDRRGTGELLELRPRRVDRPEERVSVNRMDDGGSQRLETLRQGDETAVPRLGVTEANRA